MAAGTPLHRGVALNWGHNTVAWKLGAGRRCVSGCGKPAYMDNADGQPQHKVCAEQDLIRQLGPDGAWQHAAAGYPKRGRNDDGGRPGAR
jgi:hypothetical protein